MARSLRIQFPGAFYHVMARFALPDTAARRRRLVEHLDRRAVSEDLRNCGLPELPAEVD